MIYYYHYQYIVLLVTRFTNFGLRSNNVFRLNESIPNDVQQ